MHRSWFAVLLATIVVGVATPALASFHDAWQCAKGTVVASGTLTASLLKKAEALSEAEVSASMCIAVQGGDAVPYVAALGALSAVKIASPDSIPNGQCKSSVHATVARPVIEGISDVLPDSGPKSSLISMLNDPAVAENLWGALVQSPVGIYAVQLDCACDMIDATITLTDYSDITNAIGAASGQCKTLIKDLPLGTTILDASGELYTKSSGVWDRTILGQSNAAPDEDVYRFFWMQSFQGFAEAVGVNPSVNFDSVALPEGKHFVDLWNSCVYYYDTHTMSKSSAQEVCDGMRNRFGNETRAAGALLNQTSLLRTFAPTVIQTRVANDYYWRLPAHFTGGVPLNMTDAKWLSEMKAYDSASAAKLFQPAIGSFGAPDPDRPWVYSATMTLAAARNALQPAGYNPQAAVDVAYAGAEPAFLAVVRSTWESGKATLAQYYLAKLTPTPPGLGPHGCPTAGPLKDLCPQWLTDKMNDTCLPALENAFATIKPGLGAIYATAQAEAACKKKLQYKAAVSVILADPATIDLVGTAKAICPLYPDGEQQLKCMSDINTIREGCEKSGYVLEDVQKFKTCYSDGIGRLKNGRLLTNGAQGVTSPRQPNAPVAPNHLNGPVVAPTPPPPPPTNRPTGRIMILRPSTSQPPASDQPSGRPH